MKNLSWRIIITLVILGLSVAFCYPLKDKINLGLDLQGGMHLLLKVDTSKLSEKEAAGAPERALEIIRNRIDQLGVKEPSIQMQGKDQIIVQLPGVTERQRALDIIGRTAVLEFKIVSDDAEKLKQAIAGTIPEGYELKEDERGNKILLEKEAQLTGVALADATVGFGEMGTPEVHFTLTNQGAKKFGRLTEENIGKRLAIILDSEVQSAPTIQSRISDSGRITGNFDINQANDLAIVLRAGALPAPVKVIEERTVGPLLGQDSINAGIKATLIGGLFVVVFMAVYYLLAGIIADIALALNFVIILGALGYFHATLTLPGIAGIILTLGMAVDANVLIYERMREELKIGRPIRLVIANGYHKAFSAILDSNVTTIIAAALLFMFGSGAIKGFAVTLSIGLVASMFTAIFVTRVIFDILSLNKNFTNIKMLKLIGETKIDFIGMRRFFYILSITTTLIGLIVFGMRGHKNFGVDFTGGSFQEYKFEKKVEIDKIRSALNEIGLGNASIQGVSGGGGNQIIIRTYENTYEKVVAKFKDKFPDNKFETLSLTNVGPSAGRNLGKMAILSLTLALLGILIYVWIRFKNFGFAAAGIISLLHDVLIAAGIMAITHREFSLTIVAALLTIAGYSINDTIVIYDRIRENWRTMRKLKMGELINLSVNECMSRTILTTSTVLITVLALFLFGGEVLNDFAFCLLIGFTSGAYSTVFVASPLVLFWQKIK